MKLESAVGADEFFRILMTWMHSSARKFHHKKKKMFGRNYTRDYQNLLIWAMSWIKKLMKILVTPMISMLALRYVSLMNEGENDGQSNQSPEAQIE